MRPAEHRGHARDLSALIDLVSHSCVEVGTRRKQRVQVGHLAVLIDEAVDPVEAGVQRASHHLALVVNALGGSAKSEVLKLNGSVVFPRYGVNRTGAVSRAAYGVALIVDRECDPVWIAIHRRKSSDSALFP